MEFLKEAIAQLKEAGLYRELKTHSFQQSSKLYIQDEAYLNFCSNDYLGLANHPRLIRATHEALDQYGLGSGSSRLINGNSMAYQNLENALAQFKETEAAVVFNSGYQANLGALSSLCEAGDHVFSDELNHASIIDGLRLCKAKVIIYPHNDVVRLKQLIEENKSKQKNWIVTESVFSMDGDCAPLKSLYDLALKHDAYLYLDEAHATGVLGERGRGLVELAGLLGRSDRIIQMGTLGKALGSFGAYLVGSSELKEFLINKARSLIYTTGLPPSILAASHAAITLISDNFSLKEKLWENLNYFEQIYEKVFSQNIKITSPIIPIKVGSSALALSVSQKLWEKKIWASAIRYPTVAQGTERIRLTLSAAHKKEEIQYLVEQLRNILGEDLS